MLAREAVLKMFRDEGAMLEGHFLLTSGLHSPTYLQCARVLCHPDKAEALGRALAEKVRDLRIEAVVSPAMGGLIIGHETARALGVRHIFAERVAGAMALRRGFEVGRGERFLAVEDVLTTGGSIRETMALVRSIGGEPAAACSIVLRGADTDSLGVPYACLIELVIPTWKPEECPLCRSGAPPAVKPGSRGNY